MLGHQRSSWPGYGMFALAITGAVFVVERALLERLKTSPKVPLGRVLNINPEQIDPIIACCWLLSVTESPACSRLIKERRLCHNIERILSPATAITSKLSTSSASTTTRQGNALSKWPQAGMS